MIDVNVEPVYNQVEVTVTPEFYQIEIGLAQVNNDLAAANAKRAEDALAAIIALDIGQKEKRHSWEPPYSYIGIADADMIEDDAVWTISRMEIGEDGSSDKKIALGAWTNRNNLTYS